MSRDLDKQRLYKDLAWTWPIISPPEDYREEARQFQQAISKHSKIEVRTLLDIGCGGGYFTNIYFASLTKSWAVERFID